MSKKAFTWVVAFTVDPIWVADGFSLSDDRALDMLSAEVRGADDSELAATVINAPSALRIAREQGYHTAHPEGGRIVRELIAGTPHDSKLRKALISAINLLDGVAFVAKEGDTAKPLTQLREALALITDGAPIPA